MRRRLDPVSLVGGLGLIALGLVVLGDAQGELSLDWGTLGPLMLAVVGATLLASGLGRGR